MMENNSQYQWQLITHKWHLMSAAGKPCHKYKDTIIEIASIVFNK